MSEDSSLRPHRLTWLERLSHFLLREPEDRNDLVQILHSAFERHLLDTDSLSMIEGVFSVSEMRVRDIMVPRNQMDVIDIADPPDKFISFLIEKAHSRFPVIDSTKDNVLGILLAKDLLRYYHKTDCDDLSVRDMLRPVIFIPESKRLSVLLKDFRHNRNHMAIVVDEYGGVAGLVTIEDVMEQIVGDIEDEFDYNENEDNILQDTASRWRVKGTTPIADLNTTIGTALQDDQFDTVAGFVVKQFGCLPKHGDTVMVEDYCYHVLRADSRRIYSLLIERQPNQESETRNQE